MIQKINKGTLYIDLFNKSANYPFDSIKKEINRILAQRVINKITLDANKPLFYPHLKELLNFLDICVKNKVLGSYGVKTNIYFITKNFETLKNYPIGKIYSKIINKSILK